MSFRYTEFESHKQRTRMAERGSIKGKPGIKLIAKEEYKVFRTIKWKEKILISLGTEFVWLDIGVISKQVLVCCFSFAFKVFDKFIFLFKNTISIQKYLFLICFFKSRHEEHFCGSCFFKSGHDDSTPCKGLVCKG